MNTRIYLSLICLMCITSALVAQCDLVMSYDEAGNRIFKGTPCDPGCSTHVLSTDDSGTGSLRKAIFCAEDGDVVTFDESLQNQYIGITSRKLIIDKNISINSYATSSELGVSMTPPENVHLQSEIDDHVIEVASGSTVLIRGLHLHPNIGYNVNPLSILNNGELTLYDMNIIHESFVGSVALRNNGILNILGLVQLLDYD